VRVHGTACFGGSLSNQWTVRDFSPNEYLPKGVRLAGYFGGATDLPLDAFQEILDTVAAGRPSPWTASTTAWRTGVTPPSGGKSAPGLTKTHRNDNSTSRRTGNGTNAPAKRG
jgi:hypothetical protein